MKKKIKYVWSYKPPQTFSKAVDKEAKAKRDLVSIREKIGRLSMDTTFFKKISFWLGFLRKKKFFFA